ncbi:H-NS histone family protein [Azoarcus indigens]|uniref:DNA-binding protein H-NS n=1 Tax=Azoarcus indigens TaxID=29545 RepID=A0A4R6E120_9RHOO|nr:H-NS histone family protein [Azoarcus indigens]NMG66183.1 H-NS histone family protein [Azoarcus indigens]TDN51353.1 DNA-binding protein H-NS [Azoarcus indigens]
MQDLKSYSLSDLKKLCVQIEKEIEKRATGAKKALIRKLEKMAQAEGLELSDLLEGAPARKDSKEAKAVKAPKAAKLAKAKAEKQPAEKKEALPPVYFNPLNPKEGWSGRGRKPNWVINWLGNGGELDDLKKKRS